jgi:hypothetical protein
MWVGIGIVVASQLESTRRGESRILANLGWSKVKLTAFVLGMSIALEAGLHGLARGLS